MSFPKQKKPRSWRVLQDWIRHYADQEELPQSRVRRAVSFMLVALPLDRSLDEEGNPLFLIKGGASMELRLGVGARTTKDIDVVFRGTPREMLDALEEAFAQPYGSFSFRRKGPVEDIRETGSRRLFVQVSFAGKDWQTLQICTRLRSKVLDLAGQAFHPIDDLRVTGQ